MVKKKKKKRKRERVKREGLGGYFVLIIVGTVLAWHSVSLNMHGFHNVDLVMNAVLWGADWETTMDIGIDGEARPLIEYYSAGMTYMSDAPYYALIGGLAIGLGIIIPVVKHEKIISKYRRRLRAKKKNV